MKYLRILILFCFVLISQYGKSQNFVTTKEALIRIEVKQADYQKLFTNNNLSQIKNDISHRFFDVVVLYLKDGSDVANALEVAFEKCLTTFNDHQEDVVDFKDEVIDLLTDN